MAKREKVSITLELEVETGFARLKAKQVWRGAGGELNAELELPKGVTLLVDITEAHRHWLVGK